MCSADTTPRDRYYAKRRAMRALATMRVDRGLPPHPTGEAWVKCLECKGAGCFTANRCALGNPAHEYDVPCEACDAEGYLRDPSVHVDPLTTLASMRKRYSGGRGYWTDDKHEGATYWKARRAMRAPVDLPIDDGHLLVTPETAAFFNALTRVAA